MLIKDCMKRNAVTIHPEATVLDAARVMIRKHVDTLPVVDGESRLVGIIRLRDLIDLGMPDFIRLIEQVDFVHDFGALEDHCPNPEILNQQISRIMTEKISVDEDSKLLHAAALFREHQLHDIPVTSKDGKLAGIASSVDIGTAILKTWFVPGKDEPVP